MAQSTPDLNKIMAMSEFFGVPTDFLLKDEYDLSFLENKSFEKTDVTVSDSSKENMVELSEAQGYIDEKKK